MSKACRRSEPPGVLRCSSVDRSAALEGVVRPLAASAGRHDPPTILADVALAPRLLTGVAGVTAEGMRDETRRAGSSAEAVLRAAADHRRPRLAVSGTHPRTPQVSLQRNECVAESSHMLGIRARVANTAMLAPVTNQENSNAENLRISLELADEREFVGASGATGEADKSHRGATSSQSAYGTGRSSWQASLNAVAAGSTTVRSRWKFRCGASA